MGDVTRSCLINARDLGRGWKTTQRWYEPRWKVKRPLIDGGIEEDGAHCSTMVLMGSPDGVKLDFASHLLMFDKGNDNGRIYLRTAAVILPAEDNARARAESYAAAIGRCADEMRSVFAGWQTPRHERVKTKVTTHRLTLPVVAFGLRTLTRHSWGTSTSDYRDVVIQRGRMVAGFSVHGDEGDFERIDVGRLATIVARRLEAAAAGLRPSRIRIPVYTPAPSADRVAKSALTTVGEYPSKWRDRAFEEYGYDSGTSVYPGSLLLALDELRPEPGMTGRAVTAERHVGWSHYVRHCAAVYTSERRAKAAAQAAFGRSFRRRTGQYPRGRPRITALAPLEPDLGNDVRALIRIKTWHTPASKSHPAMDVTSTDTAAVIRRGRMVATYALAAKGEDLETAYKLLKMVIRKLERAERKLRT